MLEKRHSAQFKGELCGDVLTLGLMVRKADQKCWGCAMDLETLQIEFVATRNLQPRASIQVGDTLLRTVGVMLLIMEVDETMREGGWLPITRRQNLVWLCGRK